jgi:hypothetical protein
MSISALVDFEVTFDKDSMPSSYTNISYLEEVVREAVEDAMNDIGCSDITSLNVWIEVEEAE